VKSRRRGARLQGADRHRGRKLPANVTTGKARSPPSDHGGTGDPPCHRRRGRQDRRGRGRHRDCAEPTCERVTGCHCAPFRRSEPSKASVEASARRVSTPYPRGLRLDARLASRPNQQALATVVSTDQGTDPNANADSVGSDPPSKRPTILRMTKNDGLHVSPVGSSTYGCIALRCSAHTLASSRLANSCFRLRDRHAGVSIARVRVWFGHGIVDD